LPSMNNSQVHRDASQLLDWRLRYGGSGWILREADSGNRLILSRR